MDTLSVLHDCKDRDIDNVNSTHNTVTSESDSESVSPSDRDSDKDRIVGILSTADGIDIHSSRGNEIRSSSSNSAHDCFASSRYIDGSIDSNSEFSSTDIHLNKHHVKHESISVSVSSCDESISDTECMSLLPRIAISKDQTYSSYPYVDWIQERVILAIRDLHKEWNVMKGVEADLIFYDHTTDVADRAYNMSLQSTAVAML